MFKSVNAFQMVVLVLILVGVVMIFMRQNNTCVMKQNKVKEGFSRRFQKNNWEDHLVTYEDHVKYPRHNNSANNRYNFCKAGQAQERCNDPKFRRFCSIYRDVCSSTISTPPSHSQPTPPSYSQPPPPPTLQTSGSFKMF